MTELIDFAKPVKAVEFVNCRVEFAENGEELVNLKSLRHPRIFFEPFYYNSGIPHSVEGCYLRKGAAERLVKAAEMLPLGVNFKIFDAWRPLKVQKYLYDTYRKELIRELHIPDGERLDEEVQKFVSSPFNPAPNHPVHLTGGAVDLTLVDASGNELDMGTGFDDFTRRAYTAYFESNEEYLLVRENRRLLYNVMTSVGFTNLPTEWWHYDYGDKFWAIYTDNKALYTGIAEI